MGFLEEEEERENGERVGFLSMGEERERKDLGGAMVLIVAIDGWIGRKRSE